MHTKNLKGAIGKGITVHHDDATQGAILLSLKANVIGSVEIYPYPTLTIAPRMKGFSTPAFLLVRRDASESGVLSVEELKASVPWVKVSMRKVSSPEPPTEGLPAAVAGDVILSVQLDHPPVGYSGQQITFKTGLAREAEYSIPVTVNVRAPLVLQPGELVLQPTAETPDTATGQVLAAVREDLDPKTLVVTSDDAAFVARVENPGDRAFRLIVAWTRNGAATPTETRVHLAASGETIDLPVRVAGAR
jgi:hypothetical protein